MIDASLCSRALDLYAHVLEGMALDATERNRVALADVRLREAAECREEAARLRGEPCMKHLSGSSCVLRGKHAVHRDAYGAEWTHSSRNGV